MSDDGPRLSFLETLVAIIAIPLLPVWLLYDYAKQVHGRYRRLNAPPQPDTVTPELAKQAAAIAFLPEDAVIDTFIDRALDDHEMRMPHLGVFKAFCRAAKRIYAADTPSLPRRPPEPDAVRLAQYRDRLRSFIELHADSGFGTAFFLAFPQALNWLTQALPEIATQSRAEAAETADQDPAGFQVRLLDLLPDATELVNACVLPFYAKQVRPYFPHLVRQLDKNIYRLSGLPDEPKSAFSPKLKLPNDFNGTPEGMVDAYLAGTPFHDFFTTTYLPFPIPARAWSEHAHIIGASGSGKTQLLQSLILDWIRDPEQPSLVIVDSQGDMLRKIEHLADFVDNDRLVIIDPEDDEPPALNMFDMQTPRLQTYARVVREQVEASVIELYNYLFGALDSQMTSKQATAFSFVARLMLSIPDATIHTFRRLMEDKDAGEWQPYITKLDPTARDFFERQFFTRQFADTREQVARRLYDFLRVPAFDRIFSPPRNTLDMFEAMQGGKIVLVNTSKALLKGASNLFGRYIIMQVIAATYERVAVPEKDRRQTYLVVDEAHEYFDKTLEDMLTQARKYRVSVIAAHQTLDQAGEIRAALMSNTSVKFAGGLSDRDARALASDMRVGPDFLLAARKWDQGAEFSCYVRNHTPKAIHVGLDFGILEEQPRMSPDAHRRLRQANRAKYAYAPPPASTEVREAPAAAPEEEKTVDPSW